MTNPFDFDMTEGWVSDGPQRVLVDALVWIAFSMGVGLVLTLLTLVLIAPAVIVPHAVTAVTGVELLESGGVLKPVGDIVMLLVAIFEAGVVFGLWLAPEALS
jgi:hypothetical protein